MKKRILSLLTLAIVLASLLPAAALANAASVYVYTSNGKGLNMRYAPSMDAEIATVIPYGAVVDILSSVNDSWAHCAYNGVTGYCKTRYFSTTKPEKHTTPSSPVDTGSMFNGFSACEYYATVRPSTPSGFVHMRWAPSKKQPIQRDYYAGQELLVISENGTWCQVLDQQSMVSGFMMSSFLTAAR